MENLREKITKILEKRFKDLNCLEFVFLDNIEINNTLFEDNKIIVAGYLNIKFKIKTQIFMDDYLLANFEFAFLKKDEEEYLELRFIGAKYKQGKEYDVSILLNKKGEIEEIFYDVEKVGEIILEKKI